VVQTKKKEKELLSKQQKTASRKEEKGLYTFRRDPRSGSSDIHTMSRFSEVGSMAPVHHGGRKLLKFLILFENSSLLFFPGQFLSGRVLVELEDETPVLGKSHTSSIPFVSLRRHHRV